MAEVEKERGARDESLDGRQRIMGRANRIFNSCGINDKKNFWKGYKAQKTEIEKRKEMERREIQKC